MNLTRPGQKRINVPIYAPGSKSVYCNINRGLRGGLRLLNNMRFLNLSLSRFGKQQEALRIQHRQLQLP
jgi:hypothetical protein